MLKLLKTLVIRGNFPNFVKHKEQAIMSVARTTEISSSSKKGFEAAIEKGIKRCAQTIENVEGAWINSTTGGIPYETKLANARTWRVIMTLIATSFAVACCCCHVWLKRLKRRRFAQVTSGGVEASSGSGQGQNGRRPNSSRRQSDRQTSRTATGVEPTAQNAPAAAHVEAEVRIAHRPLTPAELRSCTLKELRLLARERNLSLEGCLERADIEQVLATSPQ